MAKYRFKPIDVEAQRLTHQMSVTVFGPDGEQADIHADAGDWLVMGPGGSAVYSGRVFAQLFEKVSETRGQGNASQA